MIDFEKIKGLRRGMLVLIRLSRRKGSKAYVLVKCDCGVEKEMQWTNFNGRNKSCGCNRTPKKNKYSGHPLYTTWQSMLQRCNNPKAPRYDRYGGRGIRVCDKWYTFDGFCEDVINGYIKGLQLDRYPNRDGNYELGNFRWVTPKINNRNKDGLTLNEEKAAEIRNSNLPLRELMKKYNASKATITQTRSGRIWN